MARPCSSCSAPSGPHRDEAAGGHGRRRPGGRGDGGLCEPGHLWTVGPDYPETWPRPRDGWTIQIEGEPSAQLHFISLASLARRDVPIDEHVHAADVATAMHAVNAVPAVCEAPPGIRSALDLPLTRSGIGFGTTAHGA